MPLSRRETRVSNVEVNTPASNHAPPMGDERSHRVDDALSTLIARLLPQGQDEDDATADERHEQTFNSAKNILEGYSQALTNSEGPLC